MKYKCIFFFSIAFVMFHGGLCANEVRILRDTNLTVFFEPSLDLFAEEITRIYSGIKRDLGIIFGWNLNLRPSVLLIKERKTFQGLAESPLTVAFAVPEKKLIVVDCSRMNVDPFTMENTLKHELCHLLLHSHIDSSILPRWLDEGVCQWVSDGVGDIMMDQKRSVLNRAAFRGAYIPFSSLESAFPVDKQPLMLAYEQSKSFVNYIIGRFGKEGMLKVLAHMKKGENIHAAFLNALSVPVLDLEREWHSSLKKKVTWFAVLSYHLYDILFGLMAVTALYAFVRIMIKKRAYLKGEDGDDVVY